VLVISYHPTVVDINQHKLLFSHLPTMSELGKARGIMPSPSSSKSGYPLRASRGSRSHVMLTVPNDMQHYPTISSPFLSIFIAYVNVETLYSSIVDLQACK